MGDRPYPLDEAWLDSIGGGGSGLDVEEVDSMVEADNVHCEGGECQSM